MNIIWNFVKFFFKLSPYRFTHVMFFTGDSFNIIYV